MAEQEVLFDDIEQEIITPPRNGNKKTRTDAKEKGTSRNRYTRYHRRQYLRKNRELVRPAWKRNCKVVAPVCTPLPTHHFQQHWRWQGWPSGESTCLPPMWPGFDFRTRCHMWIEFVGPLLCHERFFPRVLRFSPLIKNQHLIWFDLWIIIVK